MKLAPNQLKPRASPLTKRSLQKCLRKALVATCAVALLYNILHVDTPRTSPSTGISSVARRKLSISYGDGTCKWQPPVYDIPDDIDFWKTIIVGYPSGDKRLTFIQMEALTGWPAKDEWDFKHLGMSNHPFIKANYPHHEGTWGWEDAGDQVVMVVRNIRRSMVEYHDILWDIGYAKTWADAFELIPNLYSERPPIEDFREWRDQRVLDEVHWYGWFIDYWMEGGLRRDIFSHNLTTPEHWELLMRPEVYSRSEQEAAFVPTTVENYDTLCISSVTAGCQPVKVISAEKLVDHDTGPGVNREIAELLLQHEGMAEYVIEEVAWECIWTELIINNKGLKTFIDRPGYSEYDYNFSPEMLEAMISQLDRLIIKYSAPEWIVLEISQDLVALLQEHKELIQVELSEVELGTRKLRDNDFLGSKERQRRRALRTAESGELRSVRKSKSKPNNHHQYFEKLDDYLAENREDAMNKEAMIEAEFFRRNEGL